VLGKAELDQLLADRERLNEDLQKIIDESTEPWGVKVTAVEIKDVEIPDQMQRAMARQAEAERERRAKIINSEGEYQAAQKLTDAADIISTNPASLQLRYLQTLLEIGSNQNTTVVFPLPMDVLEPFLGKAGGSHDGRPAPKPPKPGPRPEVPPDPLAGEGTEPPADLPPSKP
ncbi:MAG: SPFH domain-containing protein, partial [Actinobacteria bacterium]|nr:SPFH domain-containing protein [Actinomycetota bacterium]